VPNPLRARYSFRHGSVHDPEDKNARYVMRLSLALGDLRIISHYATRNRQSNAERLYFVRLLASHLREVILIMDPPNPVVVPTIEEFLAALPRGTKPSRAEMRKSHRKALRLVDKNMAKGRPAITTPQGRTRPPKLRDDLKELRNRFFHYGHDESGDKALKAAMTSLAGEATGYVIREKTMRALYADDVGTMLVHPFPKKHGEKFALDMHGRLVELIEPVSLFIHQVEAAWVHAHRKEVNVRLPGKRRQSLADLLDR
jgi:hypothetical protein